MKTQAAAIEFGTSKIVTVFAESGGFSRCEIIGAGSVYYDGYKNGVWNRPDLLAEAVRNSISAAELEAKTRIHSVYVGVPCEYIQIRGGRWWGMLYAGLPYSSRQHDRRRSTRRCAIGDQPEIALDLFRHRAWSSCKIVGDIRRDIAAGQREAPRDIPPHRPPQR